MVKISIPIISMIFSFVLIITTSFSHSSSQLVTQFEEGPSITNDTTLKTEVVSTGEIKFPTSMAFLGANDILVLEKNEGTVKRIEVTCITLIYEMTECG